MSVTPSRTPPRQERRDTFEICERIHVGTGRLDGLGDMERQAVLERTQLLEVLAQLERPGGELRELEQRTDAIGVDADVPPRTAEAALARSRTLGTLVHPLHHGLARDRPQHLSGEPRRGMTRRNDDPEHAAPGLQRSSSGSSAASWRASSSSITGTASRIG